MDQADDDDGVEEKKVREAGDDDDDDDEEEGAEFDHRTVLTLTSCNSEAWPGPPKPGGTPPSPLAGKAAGRGERGEKGRLHDEAAEEGDPEGETAVTEGEEEGYD